MDTIGRYGLRDIRGSVEKPLTSHSLFSLYSDLGRRRGYRVRSGLNYSQYFLSWFRFHILKIAFKHRKVGEKYFCDKSVLSWHEHLHFGTPKTNQVIFLDLGDQLLNSQFFLGRVTNKSIFGLVNQNHIKAIFLQFIILVATDPQTSTLDRYRVVQLDYLEKRKGFTRAAYATVDNARNLCKWWKSIVPYWLMRSAETEYGAGTPRPTIGIRHEWTRGWYAVLTEEFARSAMRAANVIPIRLKIVRKMFPCILGCEEICFWLSKKATPVIYSMV